jgi:hypothetical protein
VIPPDLRADYDRAVEMVRHFDENEMHDTAWHIALARIEQAVDERAKPAEKDKE